jgi:hypothetical protein
MKGQKMVEWKEKLMESKTVELRDKKWAVQKEYVLA